ncbi:hypothetical protein D9M72_640050 [compost metagenome]
MVAHRVRRQLQARGDFLVGQAFANQAQHIALTGGQVSEGQVGQLRRIHALHVGQFFDQRAAEPGGVLHHFLDGRHQLQLGALALGDVHQHQQITGHALNVHGVR